MSAPLGAARRRPSVSRADDGPMPAVGVIPDSLSLEGEDAAWLAVAAPEMPGRAPTASGRRLAAILMGGALFSKGLGFVREVLLAFILGTSIVADGFRSALTAVLLPLSLMANESVPVILIPMHRKAQEAGEAPRMLAALTVALTTAALVLMGGVQLLGPLWIDAIVGGFSPAAKAQTLSFVRIMALGMPGSVMLDCFSAGEIALGLSRLTTLRASSLNLSVIAAIGVLGLTGWYDALAWAFVIAFDGLAVVGAVMLCREGHLSFRALRPRHVCDAGLEFLRRMRPLLVLPIAQQGNTWIERVLASGLGTGTIASLDYARSLTDSALLLIGQPLGLAVLSAHPADDARPQMERIARPILAAALPASVFLMMFAPDVTRIVYSRGAFRETAVLLSSEALQGIAAGLWAATLGWILMRMLNSRGRNGSAALILAASYAVNAAFNLVTSHLSSAGSAGPLFLGAGETARGLVLLAGTAVMLDCGSAVLRLVVLGAIPAGVMAVLGWELQHALDGALLRVAGGAAACGACMALGCVILMPAFCRSVATRLVHLGGFSGRH